MDRPAATGAYAVPVIRELLATLPERERVILELRFDEQLSQTEIAARVGVSQMHVSRLIRRSLEDLRARMAAGEPGSDSI